MDFLWGQLAKIGIPGGTEGIRALTRWSKGCY
jgi:hypothetical protein